MSFESTLTALSVRQSLCEHNSALAVHDVPYLTFVLPLRQRTLLQKTLNVTTLTAINPIVKILT